MDANSKELQQILVPLVKEFHPEKIYLFGSQARGDARRDSDFDLLFVIAESTISPLERMERAQTLLWGSHAPAADIFILTNSEFESSRSDFGSIAEVASSDGVELSIESFA